MRDHQDRPPPAHVLQRSLHFRFGFVIQVTGGLVQDENRRVSQHHARDGQPLFLPARETKTSLADDGVIAVRQPLNDIVNVSRMAGCFNLSFAGVHSCIAQVFANGTVKEHRLLAHDPYRSLQCLEAETSHVVTVDLYGAFGHLVKSWDEICDRRLPSAGGPDERNQLSGAGLERDVFQDPGPSSIAKGDAAEVDFAPGFLQIHRVRRFLDLGGKVDIFENPVKEGQCTHNLHMDVRKGAHGCVESPQESAEGDDGTKGDLPANEQRTTYDKQDGRPHRTHESHEGIEPSGHSVLFDRKVPYLGGLLFEPFHFVRLPAEGLDQHSPADRKRFLHVALELSERARDEPGQPLLGFSNPARGEHKEGNGKEGTDGHAWMKDHHQHHRGQRRRHGDKNGDGTVAHGLLDRGDIVAQTRDDLSRLGVSEESQGLALHAIVKLGADIIRERVGDPINLDLLQHSQQGGKGLSAYPDHAKDHEEMRVPGRQRLIENLLHHDGRNQPENRYGGNE